MTDEMNNNTMPMSDGADTGAEQTEEQKAQMNMPQEGMPAEGGENTETSSDQPAM